MRLRDSKVIGNGREKKSNKQQDEKMNEIERWRSVRERWKKKERKKQTNKKKLMKLKDDGEQIKDGKEEKETYKRK